MLRVITAKQYREQHHGMLFSLFWISTKNGASNDDIKTTASKRFNVKKYVMQYSSRGQYNGTQHNTIQYNAIQYNTNANQKLLSDKIYTQQ